jgi:hypothetical protein
MVVKYKVEGTIEVDLNDDELDELKSHKTESMKKAYLKKILTEKLWSCSLTAEHELGDKVNFEELFITRDWDKYAGNMKAKNEQYGSPLGIFLEDIPTTKNEVLDKSMEEIGERKQRHSKKWTN